MDFLNILFMLNTNLVDELFSNLSKADKRKLITKLFPGSKQSMAYFHRTKDVSLSKLEILADFYHMPLDAFRVDSEYSYQVHARKITQRESSSDQQSQTVDDLNAKIKFLEQSLTLREEKIEVLEMKVDVYEQLKKLHQSQS